MNYFTFAVKMKDRKETPYHHFKFKNRRQVKKFIKLIKKNEDVRNMLAKGIIEENKIVEFHIPMTEEKFNSDLWDRVLYNYETGEMKFAETILDRHSLVNNILLAVYIPFLIFGIIACIWMCYFWK